MWLLYFVASTDRPYLVSDTEILHIYALLILNHLLYNTIHLYVVLDKSVCEMNKNEEECLQKFKKLSWVTTTGLSEKESLHSYASSRMTKYLM